ncbi:MAG: DUF1810 family protein [Chthoniobacterales bacterium]
MPARWPTKSKIRSRVSPFIAPSAGPSLKTAARAYLDHAVPGPRLITRVEALLGLEDRSAEQIFGFPDDRKLRSCATLFAEASRPGSVFHQLLDRYCHNQA